MFMKTTPIAAAQVDLLRARIDAALKACERPPVPAAIAKAQEARRASLERAAAARQAAAAANLTDEQAGRSLTNPSPATVAARNAERAAADAVTAAHVALRAAVAAHGPVLEGECYRRAAAARELLIELHGLMHELAGGVVDLEAFLRSCAITETSGFVGRATLIRGHLRDLRNVIG